MDLDYLLVILQIILTIMTMYQVKNITTVILIK
jgi:hypothetical protein